ncbi:RNA processing exonuclease, beta-lactamase fold, Cft2 family [Devosia enhydra]|uniref:RNA processing exonuclease, beta-lactamase fold, Cft2 family n=1 Tax=Devosia enhydra TaxID=665118 RepID=A0A1K2HWC3_9HYPH|nr:MBL fold metallo-hydrolase [Devosia enhydra]SFZ83034.1 RNA processing exonuclease, beta-lactamase fold, Cft2 family [Devosia enhydra]
MRLTALSGLGSKGPACFLLETDGRRILLDCGKGPDDEAVPDLTDVGPVDAIVLSHAHPDHFGALDLSAQLGRPPIYTTALTAEIAGAHRHGEIRPLPLCGAADILDVPVLTGRAGHAPGGIWIRFGGDDGLLYTGDFCHEGVLFPVDPFPTARLLVADAAYGVYEDRLETGIAALLDLARKGPMLLPVPAAGRGLEIAVLLHEAGFPIGLCPAHTAMVQLLLAHPDGPSVPERDRLAKVLAAARPLDTDSKPEGVALAASANAESGLARTLITAWAGRAEIVFTGHRARGTASADLVDRGAARFIRWNVHPLRSHLVGLLQAVRPEQAMLAFLPEPALSALTASLPGPARFIPPEDDPRHRAVMRLG